jgi:hypothetical protein
MTPKNTAFVLKRRILPVTRTEPSSWIEELSYDVIDRGMLRHLVEFEEVQARELGPFLEYPEPGLSLDLESRSSASAQFKHLHQVCTLHVENFVRAKQIAVANLVSWYLHAVRTQNPLSIYAATRAFLEEHSFLYYVRCELAAVLESGEVTWKDRGTAFFDVVVHARYGSTDAHKQQVLKDIGLPDDLTRPIRISKARKKLGNEIEDIDELYSSLSDYVHPNMSSQKSSGITHGPTDVARSAAGGELRLPQESIIVRYEYPPRRAAVLATHNTANYVIRHLEGAVAEINKIPRSPFTEGERLSFTGSKLGFQQVHRPSQSNPAYEGASRNEPCPCGSGLKFKKCHGASNTATSH